MADAVHLGVDIGNIEDMLIRANQEIWKSYLTIENLFRERQELSRNLLLQERERGAIESKNIAMATLSHYLNNATMAIYGRSQLLRLMLKKGEHERLLEKLDNDLEVVDQKTPSLAPQDQRQSPVCSALVCGYWRQESGQDQCRS